MVIYTVTAYTGNRTSAGTTSYISIQFQGPEEDSDNIPLNGGIHAVGFHTGSERKFEVHYKKALGELVLVKIRSKAFLGLVNEWFCDKILITTPEGDEMLFPCYRWLACNEKLVLRPAKALLVFKDTNQVALQERRRQLENRQDAFRWSVYAEGTPHIIDFDSALALPAELRFSYTKNNEFFYTAGKQLALLKLIGLADCRDSWESICQMEALLCGTRNETLKYVIGHWDKDEFFGYQFLNGLNPMVIQRCSKLPENFPVTEEMVKNRLGKSTLTAEIENGNIFLCDYKMLDGLIGNEVNGEQQFLTAPLVLLHLNHHGKMLPIAIQLKQTPGHENPIFLPTDEHDWLLAKIFVRAAEFSVHEVDFHLLRTHLLAEVFTVAMLRDLPPIHPLFKLLIPHTRYTLHINILARNRLISEDGAITMYSGIGGSALSKLLRRATASLTYSSLCLPDNISERGLEDVPNYYYREDGLKLWNILHKYVEGVLQYYYKSDEDVQKDTELQKWISGIFTEGFLGRKKTGIPDSFATVKDLIKFVTMVIFTASAQHAAVNNGQFDFGGWMPNLPTALRKPPPKVKGQTTEKTILETLPNKGTTVNGMAVLKLLSSKSSDHYPLGSFPEDLFDEDGPRNHIEDFQKQLEKLSGEIEGRNKCLDPPYTFLNPTNVDNSVAI
ncbi:polyunsaturated fatty acid lipoxygenase ALOX15B-like [Alosa sapidissima]|uniref:polyunsaturated fatty acid lipoxygenase ALOX15B-like n=1 Tax=Alosa sapidissima TaxID=34773 RepID=UPI001C085475|nr:polyunsaturated fatty acid lipoxygenase ALOX15B-like [Alosa sapidissima]XP_041958686.1 polyunsaturated fatty acid lipoxygenase ALOX15B-like [Alosa sapidissima]XP_041958687.1 polyunsaturated fatty acid lipoxygenase ALOX15B-like [Alosa sapidissima]